MDLGISGKTALVTGGAQGIGEAIVRALLKEGVQVYFTTRSRQSEKDLYKKLGSEYGSSLYGIVSDLEGPLEWQSSEDEEMYGVLGILGECVFNDAYPDILVNNAGSTLGIQDPYCSTDELREVMRLNFEIPRELANKCIPYMRRKGWGRIVNIGSCSGLENRGPSTFCAAKAALTAWTKAVGCLLARTDPGIVMSAVYPGVVYTAGGHWEKIMKERPEHWETYKKEIPVGRFGEPFEIASQVAFLCSDLASFHHGSIIGVDGGLSKGFAQWL